MSGTEIPAAAIDAAARVIWDRIAEDDWHPVSWELAKVKYGGSAATVVEDATRALEAAAPYMLANLTRERDEARAAVDQLLEIMGDAK
ncbi:MAG: hypothetical protein M3536_00925 [Actinomycetota bacterium]|nr:hypothetical protein [Actinomycetota bacterium]